MNKHALVFLSLLSLLRTDVYAQSKLSHTYRTQVRLHSSFYGTVAFEQHRYAEMLEMDNGDIVFFGCNRALTHVLVQHITRRQGIDSIELPQNLQEYYRTTSLTFGNAQQCGNTIVLLLNGRFILHLKQRQRSYQIEKFFDIKPMVDNLARKVWLQDGSYYLLLEEPTEVENPQCDLYRADLIHIDPKDSSYKSIWRKEFLKRYTRNTYFNNYFLRNNSFVYFNPLTYEVHAVALSGNYNETVHHFADSMSFQKSNEHMLFLAEQNSQESNIKQYINITGEEYVKDRIALLYPCKEGYFVWKTNYPKKDSCSLDFVRADFRKIHRGIEHFFYYSKRDTTEIGNFSHFPFFPRANYLSFFGNTLIVAVNHSGVHYTTSATHADIWKEFYKTIGRSYQGKYTMDYYIFNYTLIPEKQ